jgi:ketosteroid isomerase-like protein
MKILPMIALLTLLPVAAVAGPKEKMLATDKAFAAMSLEKGAHAAFLAYMADDVRLFDGPKPPITGKAAVAAYYQELEKKPRHSVLDWTPVEAKASDDGVLGWTRGAWTFTATGEDGKAQKLTGYYVTLWRRQAGGKYKFELDIGGVDKPAQ